MLCACVCAYGFFLIHPSIHSFTDSLSNPPSNSLYLLPIFILTLIKSNWGEERNKNIGCVGVFWKQKQKLNVGICAFENKFRFPGLSLKNVLEQTKERNGKRKKIYAKARLQETDDWQAEKVHFYSNGKYCISCELKLKLIFISSPRHTHTHTRRSSNRGRIYFYLYSRKHERNK